MRRGHTLRACLALGALLALGAAPGVCGAAEPPAASSALPPALLEADWLLPQSLRQAAGVAAGAAGAAVSPESDAAGGCDGVRNGSWGFHTAHEEGAWWQVDLGRPLALDRLVLYNRCDVPRNNGRFLVLLSADGTNFAQVWQHDGSAFLGETDGKPLTVPLGGQVARFVKLQRADIGYFYFDEVEAYAAAAPAENCARGRPATQSSVSQWSVRHGAAASAPDPSAVAKTVERGRQLAERLRRQGVAVDDTLRALAAVEAGGASGDTGNGRYLDARRAVRTLALRNPRLDFDSILFVKSAPGMFPHMSDQFYGWWARPGGGVYVLEGFKSRHPTVRCLTGELPAGSYLRPDLSFDGKKVLFAYARHHLEVAGLADKADKSNVPEDAFYHVFEVNLDGSGRRQLTHGRYDDFDAHFLPDGGIVFLSTRKGRSLQCSPENAARTLTADLPDSYVRCGGDNFRPVPVFTLHAMDAQGGRLRPLSAFENFEYTPSVADDGRLLYTRWDYIDRFNGHFFSLWSTNPDGSNPQLVYGNFTVRPQSVVEARSIPGSPQLVFTAAAHHSILGGSLVRFDRRRGLEELAPLVRLTPEVPFPETEGAADSYYAAPFPLSEDDYLCAWSPRALPPHCRCDDSARNPTNATGLYLYDSAGNLELLYRDPELASTCPIPVRPRARPPVVTDTAHWNAAAEGRFLVRDVYQGLSGVGRGTIRALRIVGTVPKVQPHMNRPSLGITREDTGKFVLGTVPVEADGSAFFRAPSGVSVFFQALDAEGCAVQTMRSLTYVWPGQTLACVGCHESRDTAPASAGGRVLAARRRASPLTPGPPGAWPLRFDALVQPVLDRNCVNCHRPAGADTKAARLDLTAPKAYEHLLAAAGGDLGKLANERDRSIAGECVAHRSRLLEALEHGPQHAALKLDAESRDRLVTWMDLYAQRQGCFSEQQEAELSAMRTTWAALFLPEPKAAVSAR